MYGGDKFFSKNKEKEKKVTARNKFLFLTQIVQSLLLLYLKSFFNPNP